MKNVIFFDCDGVLSDFVRAALDHHKVHLPFPDVRWSFYEQVGFSGDREALFWGPLQRDFWASLPVHDDGLEVFRWAERAVGAERIGLLTSPIDSEGCVEGKRDWVARHLPAYKRRLFVGSAKDLFAGPGKILVDDYDVNVDKFVSAGGLAVKPPRPWNSRRDECLPCGGFRPDAVIDELKAILEG